MKTSNFPALVTFLASVAQSLWQTCWPGVDFYYFFSLSFLSFSSLKWLPAPLLRGCPEMTTLVSSVAVSRKSCPTTSFPPTHQILIWVTVCLPAELPRGPGPGGASAQPAVCVCRRRRARLQYQTHRYRYESAARRRQPASVRLSSLHLKSTK